MALSRAIRTTTLRVAAEQFAELPVISVIGLGYVGVVSVGCLASRGFKVVGADLDESKVTAVATGRSPIVERGLDELLSKGVRDGQISATRDVVAAVTGSEVTLLSVGTPTSADGGCDLTYVRAASRAIGQALALKSDFHHVILRCSVPPGTTLDVVAPEIEAASGKVLGRDFGICFSPEFLREGTAVADFADPPKVVVAATDPRTEAMARRILAMPGQRVLTSTIAAAETLKYIDNVWHATKVVFANEVGRFCKPLGVDSHEVMRLFVEDTKLNLSPYYLKPGFAFGGSCLPKEVRAAMHIGAENGVSLPLIDSLLASNDRQIAEAHSLIKSIGGRTVGIFGLTFKPGTDDLRESPMLELMARLLRDGLTVRVCDPNLQSGPALSAQLRAIGRAHTDLLPVLEALQTSGTLDSTNAVMETCEVVVVSHATEAFRIAVRNRRPGVHIVDLARLFTEAPDQETYHGISW